MRFDGTLKKWNADRGFGFVVADQGGEALFLHVNEVNWFIENCPGVQMDGDGDGVPCEQQWCTGIFGN